VFAPRREHARFCSARCRVAWNRANTNDPAHEASALQWACTAMSDTTSRLSRVRASNRPQVLAVIGEAVWWVTIVDATLVRHHPEPYDSTLASQPPAERRKIEATLAGLRFVRNRIGLDIDLADLIDAKASQPRPGERGITAWTWKPMAEPELAALSPRGREWEMARYQAYQAQLAGRSIRATFGRAAGFLSTTTAKAGLAGSRERQSAAVARPVRSHP
jgi:hypothetical protein